MSLLTLTLLGTSAAQSLARMSAFSVKKGIMKGPSYCFRQRVMVLRRRVTLHPSKGTPRMRRRSRNQPLHPTLPLHAIPPYMLPPHLLLKQGGKSYTRRSFVEKSVWEALVKIRLVNTAPGLRSPRNTPALTLLEPHMTQIAFPQLGQHTWESALSKMGLSSARTLWRSFCKWATAFTAGMGCKSCHMHAS
jgi:hypothetical protein